MLYILVYFPSLYCELMMNRYFRNQRSLYDHLCTVHEQKAIERAYASQCNIKAIAMATAPASTAPAMTDCFTAIATERITWTKIIHKKRRC